ncbi:hypothetical protein Taro_036604 [Colocasia esculenta]|uniref:Fucosyltransferase n=1 Tax=Colocasia esculenta TaxID=4460 RepID=A0A843W8V2_COLES|nr:hypothetical protein [Colocasia esculenta]
MLESKKINSDGTSGKAPPPFVCIHLDDDYQTKDMYSCEKEQPILGKVPWLFLRYYRAYMAATRERLDIQIMVFNAEDSPFEHIFKQVVNYTLKEKLLLEVDRDAKLPTSSTP